jgi:predicted Zn-dependent protease
LIALAGVMACPPAKAQNEALIRDDEIERMLKGWIRPVIIADGLDPNAVKIILVQSPEINAFVAGGQNIFIYTGLLLKSDNASEIVAVMSHELGHIAGGHLIRGAEEMQDASFESLLGTVLGLGAAVAGGSSGTGIGVAGASSSMAMRNYLAFSRVQESSADQAALSGMRKARYNPSGMITFLQKMQGQELLPASQQDEYIQTHPLTPERIDALKNGVSQSPYRDSPEPASWADQHARMRAKLIGFINPEQVAWDYPDHDQSIPARYARAIAAYRQNHVEEALKGADGLLQSEPGNPWFMELKGQMLVDFGRVRDSLPYYRKSISILPDSGLIRIAYGSALVESADDAERAQILEGAQQLERATQDEPRSIQAQHELATAYGRLGNEPLAKLHVAEEAFLKGDRKFARQQANEAMMGLKPGTSGWLKDRDLIAQLDQQPDHDSHRGIAMPMTE